MEKKKRMILIVVIILLLISIFNLIIITDFTGWATQTVQGTASICINYPPVITTIGNKNAIFDQAFNYQVQVTDVDGDSLTYYDNTSLFNITQTGLISLTPQATDNGTYSILITVDDNSICFSPNATEIFSLTISEEEEAPAGGRGGGGKGGAAAPAKATSIALSEEIIKVSLKETQELMKKITVTNNGETEVTVTINNPLSHVIRVTPDSFELSPNEEKKITLTFNPYKRVNPDIYSGTISVTAARGSRKATQHITIILEVESEEVLFDASLDLSKKSLLPGEEIQAAITVFNLKQARLEEVELLYSILDFNNNILYESSEMITLTERVSFSKSFSTENLPPGKYFLAIKIPYRGSFASATEMFTIEEPEEEVPVPVGLAAPLSKGSFLTWSIPLFVILIIITIVAAYFLHKKIRKRTIIKHHKTTIVKPRTIKTIVKEHKTTVIKPKIIQPKVVVDRRSEIKRKLALLKEGYQEGHISKKTYQKIKAQLKEILSRES